MDSFSIADFPEAIANEDSTTTTANWSAIFTKYDVLNSKKYRLGRRRFETDSNPRLITYKFKRTYD